MSHKNYRAENNIYASFYKSFENDWINNESILLKIFISRKQDFSWYGFNASFAKSGVRIYQYGCLIITIHKKSANFDTRVLNFLIKHLYIKSWQN